MASMPTGLTKLVRSVTGDTPVPVGESFNLHFATEAAFIKVTRSWVKPARFFTEVAAAQAMVEAGVPVARPLVSDPLPFLDERGCSRWATFWERLTEVGSLAPEAATKEAAAWIERLWALPAPAGVTRFQLGDFLHAVHVRLDASPDPLGPRIIAEVEALSAHDAYARPHDAGFIHGDLHNDNLMLTDRGLALIDWESSCVGPLEWDVAQNLRYTPPSLEREQEAWWQARGVDWDRVQFYRRVRTLSSLSHMVAAGLTPPMYHRALATLGWA